MGIKMHNFSDSRGCNDCTPMTKSTTTSPNPNPYKFTIKGFKQCGDYCVLLVNYPDCTTFNGDKVLVLEGECFDTVKYMEELDPHFLEDNNVVIRFRGDQFDFAVSVVEGL